MKPKGIDIPEKYGDLAMDALAEYERVFGELTFSNVDMTAEAVKAAIASGKPLADDVPDDAVI